MHALAMGNLYRVRNAGSFISRVTQNNRTSRFYANAGFPRRRAAAGLRGSGHWRGGAAGLRGPRPTRSTRP